MKDRLIQIADPHIKFKDGTYELEYSMQVLYECLKFAKQHDADIMILGDLIDQCTQRKDRMPVPLEVLLALREWFAECRSVKTKVYWIRGNHITKDHSNPEHSIIQLFSHLAKTVTRPAAKEGDDWYAVMVPWYPRAEMENRLAGIATQVKKIEKKRYLFTHVALREGLTESGNHVVNAMSVERLYPRTFHRVLLGDYHRRQTVGYSHVQYLGIPTPRKRNDGEYFSVFLHDLPSNDLTELPLTDFYPRYRTYKVTNAMQVSIKGYDPRNHNRIICPSDLTEKFAVLYPDAELQGTGEFSGEVHGRVKNMDILDTPTQWESFCDEKGLGIQYRNLGCRYLRGETYETQTKKD